MTSQHQAASPQPLTTNHPTTQPLNHPPTTQPPTNPSTHPSTHPPIHPSTKHQVWVLKFGAGAAALGYLGYATTGSPWVMMLSRVLPGLFRCQTTMAQAYIADVSDEAQVGGV